MSAENTRERIAETKTRPNATSHTEAMRPDVSHRHRLGGLLPLLDDHDRAQSSSASRVTAGASGFFALTQSRVLDTHGIGERSEIFQIPNRLNQFAPRPRFKT